MEYEYDSEKEVADFPESEKTPILHAQGDRLGVNSSDATDNKSVADRTVEVRKKHGYTLYIYFLTFFSAIGGFLFGYDTGVISGAMLLLKTKFDLTHEWQEVIVSITIAGAIIGALSGGWFTDKFGRKPVLLVSSLIFSAGAVVMGVAESKAILLIGRAIVGVGIGYASSTVPMYISEAAPANIRGCLVTVNQIFITFGQCIASILDGIFSYDKKNGWRYMLGLAGIPSTIMFFGFLFMPESPRWLISKGQLSAARKVLQKLRGDTDIENELDSIVDSCMASKMQAVGGSCSKFSRVLNTYYTRRALIVGCALQAFQQLCGINTVMYYSATIISYSGVSDESEAIWLAAAVASGNFVFTLVAIFFVERAGRRKLVLGSLFGIVIALSAIGAGFLVDKLKSTPVELHQVTDSCSSYSLCYSCIENKECGFCYVDMGSGIYLNGSCLLQNATHIPEACTSAVYGTTRGKIKWNPSSCPTSYAWITVMGMIFYLAMFAPGMGPMAWVINSEIYPLWARSIGSACSTATNWFFNLLISLTFLHLMDYITRAGAFFFYSGLTCLGLVFMFLLLPETKGESLEEVEELFKGPLIIPSRKK